MVNAPHNPDEENLENLSDNALRQRSNALEAALNKVAEADAKDANKTRNSVNASNYAKALRMVSDFVAGPIAGAGVGWGIDYLFSTSPWGLIIFMLFGFAAGFMNIVRVAQKQNHNG